MDIKKRRCTLQNTNVSFMDINTGTRPFTTGQRNGSTTDNQHTNVWCDQCGAPNPVTGVRPFIQGIRYRCSVCPNFDLCSQCIKPTIKMHPMDHLFLRIDVQQRAVATTLPAVSNRSAMIHGNSTCVGCQVSGQDFQGIRYQCAQCQVDLCEACEAKGTVHDPSHMRLKFSVPVPAMRVPTTTAVQTTTSPPTQTTTQPLPPGLAVFMMAPSSGRNGNFMPTTFPAPASATTFLPQTSSVRMLSPCSLGRNGNLMPTAFPTNSGGGGSGGGGSFGGGSGSIGSNDSNSFRAFPGFTTSGNANRSGSNNNQPTCGSDNRTTM